MTPNPLQQKLLTTNEAADYLSTTVGTLAIWRTTGRYQIPFIKVGRKVLYRHSDLDNWLISRTHTHTQSV